MDLKHFIGHSQLSAIKANCRGEEGEFFREMLKNLETTISAMPKTYETDGQGDQAVLHYFRGSSDWYILEKDREDEQIQAFGFACLNGDRLNAELGYINIAELIKHGVELDLYYTPETMEMIRKRFSV